MRQQVSIKNIVRKISGDSVVGEECQARRFAGYRGRTYVGRQFNRKLNSKSVTQTVDANTTMAAPEIKSAPLIVS
jgi:hypothetical protein